MRQIGSIEERQLAERFVAYLIAQGIPCSFDSSDSGWKIWIQREDDVEKAREELKQFRTDPEAQRYRDAVDQAATVLRQQAKQADAIRRRTVDMRDRWNRPASQQAPVTFGLIALMVVAFVAGWLGPEKRQQLALWLMYTPDGTFSAIRSGEVWRLITPIFLHGDELHLLFNLFALRSLGLFIEPRIGSLKFVSMILVIAVFSNSAQFVINNVPFVGMSGVVYGLFGYAWVRGRLEPESGFWLPRQAVTMMMGWFVLCFLMIPNIANWVHAGGLVSGALFGLISPAIKYLRRR